jgi:hypothetical protein
MTPSCNLEMLRSPVYLLSSTQPAKSASENALTKVDLSEVNVIPSCNVPRRYRSTRFTAIQCTVVRAWRNWHTLLIEKDKLGLVNVRYCSVPTMLRYAAISFSPSLVPPSIDNRSEVHNGVHYKKSVNL